MSLSTPASLPHCPSPCQKLRYNRADRTRDLVSQLSTCEDEAERHRICNELAAVNMPVADSVVVALPHPRRRHGGPPAGGLPRADQGGPPVRPACRTRLPVLLRADHPGRGAPLLPRQGLDGPSTTPDPGAPAAPEQRRAPTSRPRWDGRRRPTSWPDHLDEDPADVREALDGQGCFTPTSLDRPVSDERGPPLGELIGVDDDGPGGRRGTGDARSRRTPARVDETDTSCELRFYEGLTQREIADDIGVTQMQVSRLLSRIFRDLRDDLGYRRATLDVPLPLVWGFARTIGKVRPWRRRPRPLRSSPRSART